MISRVPPGWLGSEYVPTNEAAPLVSHAGLLPFEDLPKTPLLDLLPIVSLVGDDVLTDVFAKFRRTSWAFAGAAWRATMAPTEAMDRAETFIVSMINDKYRGLGLVVMWMRNYDEDCVVADCVVAEGILRRKESRIRQSSR